jgi:hypothetical protein
MLHGLTGHSFMLIILMLMLIHVRCCITRFPPPVPHTLSIPLPPPLSYFASSRFRAFQLSIVFFTTSPFPATSSRPGHDQSLVQQTHCITSLLQAVPFVSIWIFCFVFVFKNSPCTQLKSLLGYQPCKAQRHRVDKVNPLKHLLSSSSSSW